MLNLKRQTPFAIAWAMWLTVGAVHSQTNRQPDASPGPQAAHLLEYHERLRRIVLVKTPGPGASDAAEIWLWDGRRWQRSAGDGPPPRTLAAVAYDSKGNQLVVFGGRVGRDGITRGDTWEWNSHQWRERPDTGVGIRNHHAMAFDERRGRIVMFGGTVPPANVSAAEQLKQRGQWHWPADTWEWDGDRWHRITDAGPGARSGTSLAYDAARRNVVLFGGVGEDGVYRAGTWIWNGVDWRLMSSEGPPLRASHHMVYDANAQVVVLYGGGNSTGRLQDMWQWNGTQWTEVPMTAPTPGPRNGHAMAFDSRRKRLVLHGGYGEAPTPLGDTWEWDGRRWLLITPTTSL